MLYAPDVLILLIVLIMLVIENNLSIIPWKSELVLYSV